MQYLFFSDIIEISHDYTVSSLISDSYATYDELLEKPLNEECPVLVKVPLYKFRCMLTTEQENVLTKNNDIEGTEIDLRELFKPEYSRNTPPRHVSVCSPAGMGKTTILQRFSYKAIMALNDQKIVGLEKNKLVLFLHFNRIDTDNKCMLKELLFSQQSPDITLPQQDKLYDWMVKNKGENCLIVADGFDQFRSDVTLSISPAHYKGISFANLFIRDLLNGRLFPRAKLLTSSRENQIKNLPMELKPDRIIEIQGLTTNSIDSLVTQLSGKKGKEILEYLKQYNQILYYMCSNVLLLRYIVTILIRKSRNLAKTTTTTTELLLLPVINLMQSKSNVDKPNISEVTLILMETAYLCTLEKRVTFSNVNLLKCHKCIYENLVLKTNEKSSNFQFQHQMLQDFFAALFICIQNIDRFHKEVSAIFNNEGWNLVIKILCGLMLNIDVIDLLNEVTDGRVVDMEKKQEILLEHIIKSFFEDGVLSNLEHIITLHECNYEFSQQIIEIDLSNEILQDFEMFCVSSVVNLIHCIKKLKLSNSTKLQIQRLCSLVPHNEKKVIILLVIVFVIQSKINYIEKLSRS